MYSRKIKKKGASEKHALMAAKEFQSNNKMIGLILCYTDEG